MNATKLIGILLLIAGTLGLAYAASVTPRTPPP